MSEKRRRPFHCGSQAGDWMAGNCEAGCSKYTEGQDPAPCPIQQALNEAWWGDGTVSEEIAQRMGLPGNELALVWPCPEHDPPWEPEA